MSKRSVVIFDWDGTLMNSSAKIVSSMKHAAKDCDLEQLEDHEVENIIGLGLPEAILALYPTASSSVRRSLGQRYSHHFVNTHTEPSSLFDGVEALLEELQCLGFQLAIATGKSRKGLNRVLEESGLGQYFITSRCADETVSKPDPTMLHEILKELQVLPSCAVMIGDTEYDLEMASRANVASIGVTYGSHSLERLQKHNPLFCVEEAFHLLDRIKKLA